MTDMATVLIVEDEDQVRVLAGSYLREQGHQTVSAATAEEALAVFEVVERIDVLFTDIDLRDEIHAGLEVAKQARERQADLNVLYATGQAVTDGIRAMMVEGSALLEKPYTVEELQTALLVHFRIGPRCLPKT
jgi:two-component system cell cycle sensor histidine kinase/response regulator CckA